MATFRRIVTLIALAISLFPSKTFGNGLSTEPTLRIIADPHLSTVSSIDSDENEKFLISGSHDKTIKVWSAADGTLIRTIPVPIGEGLVGRIDAVAISPDGEIIAASGWTTGDRGDNIYLFNRETGSMIHRIRDLEDIVSDLQFSPDGTRLVAALGVKPKDAYEDGIRVYDTTDWREISRDTQFNKRINQLAFAPDGRFVVTSYDGFLRLYDSNGRLIRKSHTGHNYPFGVAFNPEGSYIAVGFYYATEVRVFDGQSLRLSYKPNMIGSAGLLYHVAWSKDGKTLFAGGQSGKSDDQKISVWRNGGRGRVSFISIKLDTLWDILPSTDGGFFTASAGSDIVRIDSHGTVVWSKRSTSFDPRLQRSSFSVSSDGTRVGFRFRQDAKKTFVFDVTRLELKEGNHENLHRPDQTGLAITDWWFSDWSRGMKPKLNGEELNLEDWERSRSLSIHPERNLFALGSSQNLRLFKENGVEVWRKRVPLTPWAVNISKDGRYVITASSNGTITWRHLSNGRILLSLFLLDIENWILWTPNGFHASTPTADRMLHWQFNLGWGQTPDILPIGDHVGFFRPEALKVLLQVGSIERALERTGQQKQSLIDSNGNSTPEANQDILLHFLTIGISEYKHHPHLKLRYADDDARDIAKFLTTQTPLYHGLKPLGPLIDSDATADRIRKLMYILEGRVDTESENVIVIHFSGHGEVLRDRLYLLPHDVKVNTAPDLAATALPAEEIINLVTELGKTAKVILFLDVCRSGSAIEGTRSVRPPDLTSFRNSVMTASDGAVVITSSRDREVSYEKPEYENGVFSQAILDAFGAEEGSNVHGDQNNDGWLTLRELTSFIVKRVQTLSYNTQTPVVAPKESEMFHSKLFRIQ